MAFFIRSSNSQLYVAPSASDDKGFAAFFLPAVPTDPPDGYEIAQALTDSNLNGSFILSAHNPDLGSATAVATFVGKLQGLLGTGRYIIWLYDVHNFSATENTLFLPVQSDGSCTIQGLTVPLVSGISLQVQNNMQLTASEDGIVLGSSSGTSRIQFTGPNAPDQNMSNAIVGNLPLGGKYRGCISFSTVIVRASFGNSGFSWGFQMLLPLQDNPNQSALAEYLPLASGLSPAPNDAIAFDITIDPTDVFNLAYDITDIGRASIQQQYDSRRTVFEFTGKNQDTHETLLDSCYFTTWGSVLQLIPAGIGASGLRARLVFNEGEQYSANAQKSHLAPEGDFIIQLQGAAEDAVCQLQCGLQGTEFFNVRPRTDTRQGDRIRFVANQPAYAPVYPLPQSSPVTAPVQPDAPLLNADYRSSWCTIVNGVAGVLPSYLAQPKGAAFYGVRADANSTIVGHATPDFTFTPDDVTCFPMLPYSAVVPDATGVNSFSLDQIEDFERLFVSTIRKKNINPVLMAAAKTARAAFKRNSESAADTKNRVATPSGLLVDVSGSNTNAAWEAIRLAQNGTGGEDLVKMYFANPCDELVQAFQTSDLFLVIANNQCTGTAVNATTPAVEGTAAFYNDMFIGDWGMQANTGTQNRYNDYNNIIIVKGRKGQLYDPNNTGNSLIANWQKWTDKEQFAAPTTLGADNKTLSGADASQLVILSQWMQTYFEQAGNQTDTAYFGNFNRIATDPNWTGILILNMNIATLPTNLAGILSGVRNPAAFRAHHFGVNITPVQMGTNGLEAETPSSMFGLIYYNDPDFVTGKDPQPVEPDLSLTYDFVLLNLKVLFENTAVKIFQSYAQLTTNNYFGSPVDRMGTGGNTYNTMILKGALQFKGAEAIYSLATSGVNTFYFNSPVVNKVAITNATFSTIGTNADGNLVSLFSINGYWDFKDITIVTKDPDSGDSGDTCKATSSSACSCTGTATCTCADFDLLSFGNNIGEDDPRKGLVFNNLGIQMVASPYTPGQTNTTPPNMVADTSKMTFDQGRSTARPNSIYTNFALNLQSLAQGDADSLPVGKEYITVITDLAVTPISGSSWVGLSYQLNMGTPGALAANVGLTSTLLIAWNPAAQDDATSPPPVLVGIRLPGTGGGAKLISLQSVLKLSIGQVRLSCVKNADSGTGAASYSFLMMFTDIALKLLGLLKIPPNGSSLFYLFGNPQSEGKASGLGWYAMYKKDDSAATV